MRSLEEVGAARSIVIDEDGRILAGNGTAEAAAQIGIDKVKVVEADGNTIIAVRRRGLTPAQKTALALYDNRTSDLSEFDPDILAGMLAEGVDLSPFFYDDELKSILIEADDYGKASTEEGEGELPDTVTIRCQEGQIWSLGEHRLAVGDSRDERLVERLFADRQCRMTWTDPPYGVDDAAKNASLNERDKGHRIQTPIKGDKGTDKQTEDLVTASLKLACDHSCPGGALYLASPTGNLLPLFITAMTKSGFDFRWQLVWVKNQFVLGRSDYHFRHENILYGWKTNGPHFFVEDHTLDSVFEFDQPNVSDRLPTMKPIGLVMEMIKNSSKVGEIIYDCFLGSGTTLVACERLDRICYGCERDLKYASLVLSRWEEESGRIATLEGQNASE